MYRQLFILISCLFVSILTSAQIDDAKMFQAYLTGDLSYWGQVLDKLEGKTLDKLTLEKIASYEYGYIPYLQDRGDTNAKVYLARFEKHVAQLEKLGTSTSIILVYQSAIAAYHYFFNKMTLATNGMTSFKCANRSVEMDPENPVALSLKGNVEFYCPAMFGGSKAKALVYFKKSIANFEQMGLNVNNWNYVSTMLCLAQSYEKTGNKKLAIEMCQKILSVAPNFVYVRDTYYPSLLK